MLDQVNKLKIGQKVWWRGIDAGKVVSVNIVSNQYATILLGFEVKWGTEKKPLAYEATDIRENAVHLESIK